MENLINNLIREFYLGDCSAWGKVIDLLTNRMQGWLNSDKKFKDLPESERDNILPRFEAKFYKRVIAAHQKADKQIRTAPHRLSAIEIEAIKIKCCTVRTKFDLSLGTRFEIWMLKCLYYDALSSLKNLKLRLDNIVEIDNGDELFPQFELLPQFQFLPEQAGLNDVNTIKGLLNEVLEGDELIYLEVWFNNKPDPSAGEVKAAVKDKTDKIVSDAYITNLKQSFLMKSYLALLEHSEKANSLASLFQRLMETEKIHEDMFIIMMKNIWKVFYNDEKTVHLSKTEISKELWAKWKALTLRKSIQEKILVEAYRYFRLLRPPLHFCYKIEFYADNRFGSKIRQLFMEGGTEKYK